MDTLPETPPSETLCVNPSEMAARLERATPVMAQYLELKTEYPDSLLFFRMGDFYELFFEDAVIAANALSLTLTRRGKHQGDDIPLAGVPYHAADAYIAKLIRQGFRVAVCEQLEDPAEAKKRGSKSVVKRGIVRVMTPGTLTEDSLLEDRGSNRLAAISTRAGALALSAVELSTGDVECFELEADQLGAHLSALRPSETLVNDRLLADELLYATLKAYGGVLQPQGPSLCDPSAGEARLKSLYGVQTLDGFGHFSLAEISSLGLLAAYIDLTQAGKRPVLKPPVKLMPRATLSIDAATRNSLEIDRTQTGKRDGSLISALDMTVTSAGGRLLAARLQRPLSDPETINNRLDTVAWFLPRRDLRVDLRSHLRGLSDPARALSRLTLSRGNARDLSVVHLGLDLAHMVSNQLQAAIDKNQLEPKAPLELAGLLQDLTLDEALVSLNDCLTAALVEEPPLSLRDGGFIKAGFNQALDEARTLRDDSRQIILELENRLQTQTNIALKIRYNAIIGYYIEATQKQVDQLKTLECTTEFIHRQSLSNQTRYVTTELIDLDARIQRAATSALGMELALFEDLRQKVAAHAARLQTLNDAISALDVTLSNAEWAEEHDASRPIIDDGLLLDIKGGRHPVVAAALRAQGKPFTPNDVCLDALGQSGARLSLVTGPNMAGKSTFLRQNALLIIMAQAGLFVPARFMHLGVADRLFSRVGAGDDLAQGRSTFMMEMVETSAILSQATQKSFVILDEIGRGTATYDGLAIAWACAENLHEVIGCRALFATHYHELSDLERRLRACDNLCLQAREHNGELIFLHEAKKGAADRSYGVQVAKLAGMPASVVARAKDILHRLETENTTKLKLDDLPLFAFDRTPEVVVTKPSKVEGLLHSVNPDELSPKEALEWIYRLKEQMVVN